MKVIMTKKVTEANDEIARKNRELFAEEQLVCVNLIGSPGCGKTALIENTLQRLDGKIRVGVVEGDIYTSRDAERIARHDVEVIQLNTQGTCHIDASMLRQALDELDPAEFDLLFVENVGNLVCPAAFDLGEQAKVACLSVTEGSDKPNKYPRIFRRAGASVITKSDLLEHTDFDLDAVKEEITGLNREAPLFVTSAKSEEGVDRWCAWLEEMVAGKA